MPQKWVEGEMGRRVTLHLDGLKLHCLPFRLLGSYNPLLPIVMIRTVNVPQIKQTNKLKAQTNPLIQQTNKQTESTY